MQVSVKQGPTLWTYRGKYLYSEWPNGRLDRNGKRISKAEAERLKAEAKGESAVA